MKTVIKVTLRCGVKKKSIVITIMDFTVTINSTTTSKGKKPLPATHDQHKELIRRLFIRYNKLIFLIVLKSMYTNLSECRHYCTHWAEHPKESRIPISNQWQLHLIVESIAVSLFTDRIRSKSKEQSGDETSWKMSRIWRIYPCKKIGQLGLKVWEGQKISINKPFLGRIVQRNKIQWTN